MWIIETNAEADKEKKEESVSREDQGECRKNIECFFQRCSPVLEPH